MDKTKQISGWKSGCCDAIADNIEFFDIRNIMIWKCGDCDELYENEEEAKECCEEL